MTYDLPLPEPGVCLDRHLRGKSRPDLILFAISSRPLAAGDCLGSGDRAGAGGLWEVGRGDVLPQPVAELSPRVRTPSQNATVG